MFHLFPSISPFSIYQLTYDWWLIYLARTREYANGQGDPNGHQEPHL